MTTEILNGFLKRWPLSTVKKMTLEEYVDIGNPDTFTQWVETKTRSLGSIKGMTSNKFGIYKRKNPEKKPKYYQNDSAYSWLKKYGKRRSGAFKQVLNCIVKTIELAKKGDFKGIDEIQLPNLYKWKVAFLYSNQRLVPIFKKDLLKDIYQHYAGATNEPMVISKVQQLMMENKPSNLSVHEFMQKLDKAFHQRGSTSAYTGARKRPKLPPQSSFTRKILLNAIKKIDNDFKHDFAPSKYYDVIHTGRKYPPKAIVGLAAEEITGEKYGPNDFNGGWNTTCMKILSKNKIHWEPKCLQKAKSVLKDISKETKDDRKKGVEDRRVKFKKGWRDFTDRRKTYRTATLKKLTWQNLGWRVGKKALKQSDNVMDAVFDFLNSTERIKKNKKRETQFWALQGNPKFYDIVGAINNLDRDWWLTGNSKIKSGDRLLFWQSKDAKGKRGVVGFGVAIGNPVKKSGDIDNIYWTKRHKKKIKEKKKRIQVRYVKIKKPIWEDSKRNKALLNSLTVCGGQGTSFHVTEEQWEKLLKIAKIDERQFETEEVRIEGGEVAKLISIDNASIEHSNVLQETKQTSSRKKNSSKPKTYRRSKQPKQIGDWAEEFVLKFLQNNSKCPPTTKEKYPPLDPKKDVIWIARAGDKPGYDISYTSTKGKTVGVEVKGTVSKKMTSFELTSNEWKKAQELKSNYVIALVSSVGKEKTGLQFIVNPYKQLDAEPSSFECRIHEK